MTDPSLFPTAVSFLLLKIVLRSVGLTEFTSNVFSTVLLEDDMTALDVVLIFFFPRKKDYRKKLFHSKVT